MKAKDITNIWINIEKAAEILGLSIQTVKKQCRKGSFVFKIVKRGKQSHYFIHLKSLPDFAQDKYHGENISDKKHSEVPNWAKVQAEKYLPIKTQEKYENYKAAYNSAKKTFKTDAKVSKIANTNMDMAVRKNKEQKASANIDLSIFLQRES